MGLPTWPYKNAVTSQIVSLKEENEVYVPEETFEIKVGDTWELQINEVTNSYETDS